MRGTVLLVVVYPVLDAHEYMAVVYPNLVTHDLHLAYVVDVGV
jgi:hypothetical protein